MVNNRPQQHVKARLAQAILTDAIPDPRDIILVSIAEQCGLLGYVLSETQLDARRARSRRSPSAEREMRVGPRR